MEPTEFAPTLTEQIERMYCQMRAKGFTPQHVYLSHEFYSLLEREIGQEPVIICGMTVHISALHKWGYVGLTVEPLYEEITLCSLKTNEPS